MSFRDKGPVYQLGTTTAFVVAGVGASWYSWKKQQQANKKKPAPPPPPPLCEAGLLETVNAVANGSVQEFLIEHSGKSGRIFRIRLPIPGAPMVVVVANTEDARAIYRDSDNIKPPALYHTLAVFTGEQNIVSLKGGEAWFHRRRSMNPAFAPKHIKRMNEVAMQAAEEWVSEKLAAVVKGQHDEVSVDIGKEMIDITMSVICKAAFDYDITDDEKDEILEEIKLGWAEFTTKTSFNPLRKFFTWFLPDRQRAFISLERLQTFAFKVMDNHKKKATPTPDTVVDTIMKNSLYKNDKERAADIIMVLFAGHDTTGYTLALALFELAMNPLEQEKLRRELLEDKQTTQEGSYLKAVITETMRMHPVVPVPGFKAVGRDYITQYGGYLIPRASIVFQAQIAIARDASIFKDPFKFQPSRWLDPSEAAKRAFFPYALGKRNCVGQPLANAELYSALPHFIRHFKFAVEQEGEIVTPATVRLENCWLKVSKV